MPDPAPRSAKAEQTRRAIVDAALRLFKDLGYDRTTMRAIAAEAGVSVGNAYYYFGSKEHLVQAFYDQIQTEHAQASRTPLGRETTFDARLRAVLLAWLDVAEPYHAFAGKFFKNAAEPSSPLSPFSTQSHAARDAAITLQREVVAGSDLRLSPGLREELPMLLWLLQMGMVLFWVYDDTPGQQRTRLLVDRLVPVVGRLLRMSRLPVVRSVVDDVVDLVRVLQGRSDGPGDHDPRLDGA